MAYVFSQIDQSLDPNAGAKADIFSGSSSPQAGGAVQGQSAAPVAKTSTEADFGGGSNTAAVAGPGKTGTDAGAAQAANVALSQNKQVYTGTPSRITNSAKDIDSKLQDEANNYVKTQGAKGAEKNVGFDRIDAALGGDVAAQGEVGGRIASKAPTVDDYQSGVDTKIKDLDLLNSDTGLKRVLSKNANATYSQGMAGLDAMLMGQSKDFINDRQALNQKQVELSARPGAQADTLKSQAQAQVDKDFGQGTTSLKGELYNRQQLLDNAALSRMGDYNLKVGEQNPELMRAESEAALRELIANASRTGDNVSAGYLQNIDGVDPSKYWTPGQAYDDFNQFYDPADAGKFNLIESLLGENNDVRMAPATSLRPAGQLDRVGYEQALLDRVLEMRRQELAMSTMTPAEEMPSAIEEAVVPPSGRSGNTFSVAAEKVRQGLVKAGEQERKRDYNPNVLADELSRNGDVMIADGAKYYGGKAAEGFKGALDPQKRGETILKVSDPRKWKF